MSSPLQPLALAPAPSQPLRHHHSPSLSPLHRSENCKTAPPSLALTQGMVPLLPCDGSLSCIAAGFKPIILVEEKNKASTC